MRLLSLKKTRVTPDLNFSVFFIIFFGQTVFLYKHLRLVLVTQCFKSMTTQTCSGLKEELLKNFFRLEEVDLWEKLFPPLCVFCSFCTVVFCSALSALRISAARRLFPPTMLKKNTLFRLQFVCVHIQTSLDILQGRSSALMLVRRSDYCRSLPPVFPVLSCKHVKKKKMWDLYNRAVRSGRDSCTQLVQMFFF